MLTLRLATDSDRLKWDSFVSQNPEASPYHWYGWKIAVEKAYGHKGYYLIAEDRDGTCLGVLPLICMRFPWGRKALVSLPYCDYAGPLGGIEAKRTLVEEAISLAKKLQAKFLELRFPEKPHWLGEIANVDFQDFFSKTRMLLPLPRGSIELWTRFKPKLRSQIKRPQKEGLKSEIGGVELMMDFYTVFNLNMHRLGSPVHDRRWFESLLQVYGEKAKVGVVRLKNGKPVAGGIILTIGSKACVPWASSLKEYNSIAPNMLLYYQFLAWSADSGFDWFDFGRSTPGEGTYRFKEQWGSFPQPLHWYKQSFGGAPSSEMTSKPGIRDKVAAIWCKLPLSLTNYFGPKLRKYISL